MEGEGDGTEDEEGLENQASADGEGVVAPEMEALVEAMESLEPSRCFPAQIPQSGEVVRKHRTDRPGQKQRQGDGSKGRGSQENEKHDQGEKLVGNGHGKQAGKFRFTVRG
ncbi:MAG: hypothetical protein EBX19_07375 [Actinobacteria bacterium]|nr:hypothetical protein [Actinomycetota bacterium]